MWSSVSSRLMSWSSWWMELQHSAICLFCQHVGKQLPVLQSQLHCSAHTGSAMRSHSDHMKQIWLVFTHKIFPSGNILTFERNMLPLSIDELARGQSDTNWCLENFWQMWGNVTGLTTSVTDCYKKLALFFCSIFPLILHHFFYHRIKFPNYENNNLFQGQWLQPQSCWMITSPWCLLH